MAKKTKTKETTPVVENTFAETIEAPVVEQVKELNMIEQYQDGKDQTICVRNYFDPAKENMGLENYGMTLFDGVYHEEALSCLEVNGVKRYVTGLNEFAPEVKRLNAKDRAAKVKEIRTAVASLEAELAQNIIDADDPMFWNKVKLLRPDNDTLWAKMTIKCGNEPLYLDPAKDPYDLIKIFAIKAGGFSIVAKNLAEAKTTGARFYLDELEDTVSERTSISKIRNRALAALTNLYDTNSTKLMYVAKVVDSNSTQYIKSTPNDVIYEAMDEYIYGEGSERNREKAAKRFLDVSRLDLKELKILALIKDATMWDYITSKGGFIVETQYNAKLGKTTEEVKLFLENPLNEEIYNGLLNRVEKNWNA
jgi:hypothetical protein|tara:strand:+ start:116 stop:1210 length:1095 start_codon:yes stop_codon:yes gene_type:complete